MNQSKLKFNKAARHEDYEDGLWRMIMLNYAEYEGKELFEENEILKKDPQFQTSDADLKKFNKLLDKEFRKRKIFTLLEYSKKILPKISIAFFVLAFGFFAMFSTVSAFRVQVLNFLLSFEKEYTSISLGESGQNADIVAGFSNTYVPSYIPQGYNFKSLTEGNNFRGIEYTNDEDKFIAFYEYQHSNTANIDSENADIIKTVKINNDDGVFVLKNGISTVSWKMDNKIFVVYAQISEEEIVRIAENVIFIK